MAGKSPLEKQAATIRASELFDAAWYRSQYRDVEILRMDPAVHYLKYGARLARDPGPAFSTEFYRDMNPAAVERGENPLLQHLRDRNGTPREKTLRQRNPIWAAARVAERDPAQALALARAATPPDQAHALEILRANAARGDEKKWTGHLNGYLDHFGAAPVRLKPEGPKGRNRLHRFSCDPLPPIGTGPVISVLMPAWNAEATLETAARSILDQTWRPLELIIVDDASTDGTWTVMRALAEADGRVRVLRNSRNVGPYVSKNIALTQVTGDYVTGHDADDWAHPQRLEHHLRFMRADGRRLRASPALMLRMTPEGEFGPFSMFADLTPDGVARDAMIACLFETDMLRDRIGYWDNVRFGGDSETIARARLVLGADFARAELIGMLCLNTDTSLTNHAKHGLYGADGGFSPVRKKYKRNWVRWHDTLDHLDAYRPFQQKPRTFEAPAAMLNPPGTVETLVRDYAAAGTRLEFRPSFECDVCIVTDLRFPGGNASSTLDEVRFLTENGKSVILVHLPSEVSKGKPISERYDPWTDIIKGERRFERIRCEFLVVRNPSVICLPEFAALKARIAAGRTRLVVNNSAFRPDGRAAYDVDRLLDTAEAIGADKVRICPIGPLMRAELLAGRHAARAAELLSPRDWPPTFDIDAYANPPKATLGRPFRIGRHGRDSDEKWIETPALLRAAYPSGPDFEILILGGAHKAKILLGGLPDNWEVLPFGAVPPKAYLAGLDAFVYFPATKLAEAFGRTIAEAMIAGVPCILAPQLRVTFGDLAFYCAPDQVRNVVARLAEDDARRVALLEFVQARVKALYASSSLAGRFPELSLGTAGGETEAEGAMPPDLARYKRLVEGA
jgi:glycosyltransferase involved in cell wall biosynthesis